MLHNSHWVYVAIDLIASKLASIKPNIAYVEDGPIPGRTVKAGQRALLNLQEKGFGGTPYSGATYSYGRDYVAGEYVGCGGGYDPSANAFGGFGGAHSFLTVGEWRSKALSVVQPHEDLSPVENDHLLRRLVSNPNPFDTYFSYTYEKWMFGELTGVSYEWLVPNDYGVPVERWVIPSHWVWPRTGGGRVMGGQTLVRYEYDRTQDVGDAARYRAQYVPYDNPYADKLIQYYEVDTSLASPAGDGGDTNRAQMLGNPGIRSYATRDNATGAGYQQGKTLDGIPQRLHARPLAA